MPSRVKVSNAKVADALREMSLFLEMQDVPFKPRAYEKAAQVVAGLDRPLATIYAEGGVDALDDLPSIGEGIAKRIAAMLETGTIADLERLREQTPIDIGSLTAVTGVGPKRAQALWEALQVGSVEQLEEAAVAGRIRDLPGFGERSERKILDAVRLYQQSVGRRPLARGLELAEAIEAALTKLPGLEHVVVAGSIRRRRETIGDIDVLVAAHGPAGAEATRVFAELAQVEEILAQGPTKTLVRLRNGLDADLRVVEPESFGAALVYFTGSKAHNIALRRIALAKGYKLNEYGVWDGRRKVAGRTEQEVYAALDLPWIPPELREDAGEVAAAQAGELPVLIEARDIRGDLHVHSNWTDGSLSIAAMAEAARARGLEYLAITDHTRSLTIAGGLDEVQLRAQLAEVRRVDQALAGIRVLAGVEIDVLADGTLDLDEEILTELDIVGAAIHSGFEQPREQMTERMIRAIEHPAVTMLCHPTGRMLGRRAPVEFDVEAVITACRRTGTILEIDAQPARLDLPDALTRRAIAAGVRIAINSDAHSAPELGFVERFGLGVARRGWAEAADVVNTLTCDELLATL